MFIHSYDELHISATNEINFGSIIGGSGSPTIKVAGSGGNNKFLATDGSGRLTLTGNTSSSGVDSITASGELSLTGAGTGDVTITHSDSCLLYTSPSPRDATLSRMPSSA